MAERTSTQHEALIARLRATKTEYKMTSGFGGLMSFATDETREVPINPDGADAADLIEVLHAELRTMAGEKR